MKTNSTIITICVFLFLSIATSTSQTFPLTQTPIPEYRTESNIEDLDLSIELNGGLRNLTQIKEDNVEQINGSIAAKILSSDKLGVYLAYTLNQSIVDTINSTSDYGYALINPDFSGQSLQIGFTKYEICSNKKWGIFGNFALGINTWNIDSLNYKASPGLLDFGVVYRPLYGYQLVGNFFDILLKAKFSYRFIKSDVANSDGPIFNRFGIDKKGYWGSEISIDMIFNHLDFYFSASTIDNPTGVDIFPSNGIFTIGAIVKGDLLKFKLKKITL